ncbi:hypothetical protein [Bradyrhizobium tropiciagri]|uniref:hypothetical protein n=1 Tax=Bradyrhizobium tropiciagri TaxID=312253 RepID=UPI000A99D30F|nr:hypothetical protein [Bradyrhizobium tropiciagri]
MSRISSFLTIALSITAIGSATLPSAALPLKVFDGGSNHLSQLAAAAPVSTSVHPSQGAVHVLGAPPVIPPKAGLSKVPSNAELPIPVSHNLTSIKNAELPKQDLPPVDLCATHPYLAFCKGSGGGGPGGSGGGSGGSGGSGGGSSGGGSAGGGSAGGGSAGGGSTGGTGTSKGSGSGPVVLVVPQVLVRVPVAVPVTVPYSTLARVTAGSASSGATTQAHPLVTPHCMTAADNPALAAGIDQLLPAARLSDADMSKVTELRQTIQLLATDGKEAAARDVEEVAMNILGYQKVWLRCGQGTFDWESLPATTQASQAK